MFDEFAELLTQRAYPHFTNAEDRRLIVATLAEELQSGFLAAFEESISPDDSYLLQVYARAGDPRFNDLLDSLGWDEKWAEYSRAFAAKHLEVDGSDSLIPEKSVHVMSTFRVRDADSSSSPSKTPAAWPTHPGPTSAPPAPVITVNLGRKKK